MYAVDTKSMPVSDLPSFVWCTSVANVEEIENDWSREAELSGYPCPKLPRSTAEEVYSTLQEYGMARLTFFIQGHPEMPKGLMS